MVVTMESSAACRCSKMKPDVISLAFAKVFLDLIGQLLNAMILEPKEIEPEGYGSAKAPPEMPPELSHWFASVPYPVPLGISVGHVDRLGGSSFTHVRNIRPSNILSATIRSSSS